MASAIPPAVIDAYRCTIRTDAQPPRRCSVNKSIPLSSARAAKSCRQSWTRNPRTPANRQAVACARARGLPPCLPPSLPRVSAYGSPRADRPQASQQQVGGPHVPALRSLHDGLKNIGRVGVPDGVQGGQGAVTAAAGPARRVAGPSGLPAARRLFLACRISLVHGPTSITLHPDPIGSFLRHPPPGAARKNPEISGAFRPGNAMGGAGRGGTHPIGCSALRPPPLPRGSCHSEGWMGHTHSSLMAMQRLSLSLLLTSRNPRFLPSSSLADDR